MKAFIKKIFSRENLGSIAFFSTLLATLGTWSVAAWMTLGGCLIDFREDWKISIWFLLIAAVLALTALLCNLAFFYTKVPDKFKKWFLIACCVFALATAGTGYFLGKEIAFYTFAATFVWIFPLTVFHKKSYWVIPGSTCFTFFMLGCIAFCELMQNCYKLANKHITDIFAVTGNVALAGFLVIPVLFFCLARLYSGNESKKILFAPNVTVLIIFIISWGAMAGIAFHEERTYQKNLIRAGEFYGVPLDEEGLKKYYYNNTLPDADFWLTFEQLLQKFKGQTAGQAVFIDFPRGIIESKTRLSWKKNFESSSQIKELEKILPAVIPPKVRMYEKYYLFAIILDEIFLLRDFCRIQTWRLRFALENNDTVTALEALKRIDKSIERLRNDHIAIAHIYMLRLLSEKKNSLELLLESQKLSQGQLEFLLNTLIEERKKLAATRCFAFAGETVFELDYLEGIWQGGIQVTDKAIPAIKQFRWIVPQCWYIFRRTCNQIIKKTQTLYCKENNAAISSPQCFFVTRYSCLHKINQWHTVLDTQYLVLESLLKLELEKRRCGFYPDTPPVWLATDPFTGQKLHYKKGCIPIFEKVYNSQNSHFNTSRRTVKAVAIWSEGVNKKNDKGLYSPKKNECDDIRAMIRL